jgi:hypothetical protein
MKKYLLFNICILFFFLTGFLNNCNKNKILCEKCLDKNAKACHKGLCRIILSKEEIKKTDKEYYEHIENNK